MTNNKCLVSTEQTGEKHMHHSGTGQSSGCEIGMYQYRCNSIPNTKSLGLMAGSLRKY